MTDVQNQKDTRGIKIQKTGVNAVHLPIEISDGGKINPVTAKIRFVVSLEENIRGTHMSRLVEILSEKLSEPLTPSGVEKILSDALEKLETDFSEINIAFKFFVKKIAPVSGRESFSDVDCEFAGELFKGSRMKFTLGLAIPFTSLCPCSREISKFGAHNQRSICRVKLHFDDAEKFDEIEISKIVRLVETQGSGKIYPVLKREDEKFVTESAYQNPKFVEDILRDVVLALRTLENISGFEIECENFESIHNHNAFAAHSDKLKV